MGVLVEALSKLGSVRGVSLFMASVLVVEQNLIMRLGIHQLLEGAQAVRMIALLAHRRGMSVALQNDLEQIPRTGCCV